MRTIEQQLDTRELRRLRHEDKMLTKIERLERKAAPMIGELGSGRFYCYPVGGTYFESASYTEVAAFLIRNKYV